MSQTPKLPNEQALDDLLNELSYAPDDPRADALVSRVADSATFHQAPMGLAQRILAQLPEPAQASSTSKGIQALDRLLIWLGSPVRAVTACVLPLLLGMVIGGTNQTGTEALFNTADSYPSDDQLLVLAGLSDEFTDELSLSFEPTLTPAAGGTTP